MHATRATLATPPMPGAVAIIDLTGDNVTPLLSQITGINAWKPGAIRLVEFADIDQGLAVLLDEHHAQLMPHAGPRVVQRMMAKLIELGAQAVDSATFAQPGRNAPHIEVDMLDALWRAASPAAIDLLLAQPRLWREWLDADEKRADEVTGYSANLDRLLKPASVVIVGSPNVGKSTLSNTILGRAASIVADMPGTTRDFVSSPAEIDGVALRWLDTPGVRVTPDAIESGAISLAQNAIVNADLLVVLRDSEIGWPSLESLPRAPELYVIAKSERGANSMAGDPSEVLRVSSHTGAGIEAFTNIVLEKLGLTRAEREPRPWAFSPTLRGALMTLDWNLLRRYLGHE